MQIAQLFVRINGDVSGLRKSMGAAQASLSTLERQTKKLQGSVRALQANWIAVSATIGAVGVALNRTFAAADAFDASQRRLASTAKLTGQNLGFLQTVAADANRELGIGARMANEYAIEVSKLAGKAGQIEKTSDAIRALLDLGAGRGFSAGQTLQAVQQAILGIDEGTDKLFGKNPSVIYAEFAAQVGLSASKMTDQEKALALLSAALSDGGKVVGAYTEYLASNAGQSERNRIKTEELAASIGRSMSAIRAVALPVWGAIIEEIRQFVEEARGIPARLSVVVARMKVVFAAMGDAFGNSISGGAAGRDAEQRARAELVKVEAAARETLERISREMNLVQDIVGPVNPLETFFAGAAQAADQATQSAGALTDQFERLNDVLGRIRFPTLATPATGLSEKARDRFAERQRSRQDFEDRGGRTTPVVVEAPTVAPVAGGGMLDGLSDVFSQVKGQALAMAAQFGPLAAVAAALRPVFQGITETIGPALSELAEPLRAVGVAIGTVVAPVIQALADPLRAVSGLVIALTDALRPTVAFIVARITPALKVLSTVARGVTIALSYVNEAMGWLVRSIGKAVDALPLVSAKGIIKAGQEMIDAAREMRRGTDTATGSIEDLGDAAAKATAQLVNYARVSHINALRFAIGGTATGGSAGGGGSTPGGAGRPTVPGTRPPITINTLNLNGVQNARQLLDELGRLASQAGNRGGTSRLHVAMMPVP